MSLLLTIFVLHLVATGLRSVDGSIGVCYGTMGDDLPPPEEVISLCEHHNITRMRIYKPDPNILRAIRGTNIEVLLGVGGGRDIRTVGSSQSGADSWVHNHILPYTSNSSKPKNDTVKFRYIAVGNETPPDDPSFPYIVAAIQNLERSLSAAGLGHVKVSTCIEFDLEKSFPPSAGSFYPEYEPLLRPVIEVLKRSGAPLMVNVHPYYAYELDPKGVAREFVLFGDVVEPVKDGEYTYTNMFDSCLDAVYAALERYDGGSVKVVVAETGWPTAGEQVGVATIENARVYNNLLAEHVKGGTPRRPGEEVETYIFEMFNENLKTPVGTENYWGLFYADKSRVYPMNYL